MSLQNPRDIRSKWGDLNGANIRTFQQTVFDRFNASGYIENPRRADIQFLAPYLTTQGVTNVLQEAFDLGRSILYGLPCRVHGAYQVFVVTRNKAAMVDPHFMQIGWLGTGRDPNSFAMRGDATTLVARANNFNIPRPLLELINDMASTVCHEHLVQDDWRGVVRFVVADPRRRDKHHDLKPVYECVAATRYDRDIPEEQLLRGAYTDRTFTSGLQRLEQDICYVETGRFSSREVIGCREHVTFFHCSICGGGLGETRCSFCHTPIRARLANRVPNYRPLPMKIAQQKGVDSFAIHPLRGVKRYYARWATQGDHSEDARSQLAPKMNEVTATSTYYDRVIDLGTNK